MLGAARLALSLRVSGVLVGALVIGLGTSAPEILISVLGAAEGSVDIADVNSLVAGGLIALIAPGAVSDPNLPALRGSPWSAPPS